MQKLNKQIEQGLLQPERSLKETQRQRQDKPATQKAETCLSWQYMNVAEDLAESVRIGEDGRVAASTSTALPKASSIAYLDKLDEDEEGVRWMPPGTTLAEMLDCALTFLPHCKVAYSTFVGCYHLSWAKRLKIRVEGQHSKCISCEKFRQYRKQVSSPEDCRRVSEEYSSHLSDVMRDRQADKRLCLQAQISSGAVTGTVSEPVLSITIDAMDAAKFRCPIETSALPRNFRIFGDQSFVWWGQSSKGCKKSIMFAIAT